MAVTAAARARRTKLFILSGFRCLLGGAILCCAAGTGRAQILDNIVLPSVPGYDTTPSVAVQARPRPEYESPGVRAGSFVIRPNIMEGVGYNDNVLGTRGAGSSPSPVLNTSATLQANSDWSRNSLGFFAGVDDLRYFDEPQQSQTSWTASVGGTYAIGRDQLTVAASHLKRYEETTGIDVFNTSVPVPYTIDDVRTNYLTSYGRFSFRPNVSFSAYRFSQASNLTGSMDETMLNRDAYQGGLTTEYELAPQRNLVFSLQLARQHYVKPQIGQPTRDSKGGTALLGFDYTIDGPFRVYALGGFQVRQYDSAMYKSHSAPILDAGMVWTPTGLTTVTATVQRSIEDSTDETLVGYTLSQANLVVDHEYQRNILLQASAQLAYADYEQSTLTQTLYTFGASATWLLNRNLSLRLNDSYTIRQSNAGGNFNGNFVLLQLGATL